jgi:hydroxyacylglutathione hydrolase
VYLLAADDAETVTQAAVRELRLIGIDRVRGWFGADALANPAGNASQTIEQLSPLEVAQRVRAGAATVIDVRNTDEWAHGHIRGALHAPLGRLQEYVGKLPAGTQQLVLQCESGGRSGIAASVLLALGVQNVANLEGGFAAWRAAGLPVATDGA